MLCCLNFLCNQKALHCPKKPQKTMFQELAAARSLKVPGRFFWFVWGSTALFRFRAWGSTAFSRLRVQKCCTIPKSWPRQARHFEQISTVKGSRMQKCLYCPENLAWANQEFWNSTALWQSHKSAVLPQSFYSGIPTVPHCPKKTFKPMLTYSSQEPEGFWKIGSLGCFGTEQHFLVPYQKDWDSAAFFKVPECKNAVLSRKASCRTKK